MNRSVLMTSLLICLTASPAGAEEASSSLPLQSLGVSVSWLTGSGLSYRRWFENGYGYQVAGVPLVTTTNTFVNVGAQVMQVITKNEAFRIYGLTGFGVGYGASNGFGTGVPINHTDIGVPLGVGFDWYVARNVACTLGVGYTLSTSFNGSQSAGYGFTPGFSFGSFLEW